MKELKLGERVCDKCEGKSFLKNVTPPFEFDISFNKEPEIFKVKEYIKYITCEKCHGTGKLDWIENLVGKKQGIIIWGHKIVPKNRMLKNNKIVEY